MNAATRKRADAERQVVVVGNGMVGHRFVELAAAPPGGGGHRVRRRAAHGLRPRSPERVLHGRQREELALAAPPSNAKVCVGEAVTAIDRRSKTLRTSRSRRVGYDVLVLATGSYPFVPPIDGHDLPHCHVYRTIEDLEAIRASGAEADVGVVVGGGLLGL